MVSPRHAGTGVRHILVAAVDPNRPRTFEPCEQIIGKLGVEDTPKADDWGWCDTNQRLDDPIRAQVVTVEGEAEFALLVGPAVRRFPNGRAYHIRPRTIAADDKDWVFFRGRVWRIAQLLPLASTFQTTAC